MTGRKNRMGTMSRYVGVPIGKKPINGGVSIGRKNRMGTIFRYVCVQIGKKITSREEFQLEERL